MTNLSSQELAETATSKTDESVEICNPDGCPNCSRLGHYCAARGITITCATIIASDGFDELDRPRAGAECVACRRLGHYCPAKGMCGDQPLCLACGRGEICDQAKSIEKMRQRMDEFEESAPPPCRQIAIADADRIVDEKPLTTDWAIKAELNPDNLRRGLKRSDRAPAVARTPKERKVPRVKVAKEPKPRRAEVVKERVVMAEKMVLEAAKVKAAEMFKGGTKIGAIAIATGYSWAGVQYWLREAGLLPAAAVKSSATKKAKGKKAAKATAQKKTAAIVEPENISLQAPVASLDRFWQRLTIPEKIRIVERELFGGGW